MTIPPRLLEKALLIVVSAALAIPLLIYAYLGSFTRYIADDYCFAVMPVKHGFFGMQQVLYFGWQGRYTTNATFSLVSLMGAGINQLPTFLVLTAIIAATYAILYALIRPLRLRYAPLIALILSQLVLVVVLQSALQGLATIAQVFFWRTGIMIYALPLIAAPLAAQLIMELSRREWHSWEWSLYPFLGTLVGFVIAGFSETFAAALVGLLIGLLGMLWLVNRDRKLLVILSGTLVGVIVGLIVMALAPGTAVRQGTLADPLPLPQVAVQAPLFSIGLIGLLARAAPLSFALVLTLPPLLMRLFASETTYRTRQIQRILWSLPLVMFAMLACALAPGLYATHIPPPSRALIDPTYVLIIGTALISLIAGIPSERERYAKGVTIALGVLAAAALIGSLIPLLRNLPEQAERSQAYAAAWDAQDAAILASRRAGDMDVEVAPLPNDWLLDTLHAQPEWWINVCAAEFYGVESIIAR